MDQSAKNLKEADKVFKIAKEAQHISFGYQESPFASQGSFFNCGSKKKQKVQETSYIVDKQFSQPEFSKQVSYLEMPLKIIQKPLKIIQNTCEDIYEKISSLLKLRDDGQFHESVQQEKIYITKLINLSDKEEYMLDFKWAFAYTEYLSKASRKIEKIDNRILLADQQCTLDQNFEISSQDKSILRISIKKEEDYVLLNEYSWNFVRALYGGGPQLKFENIKKQSFPEKTLQTNSIQVREPIYDYLFSTKTQKMTVTKSQISIVDIKHIQIRQEEKLQSQNQELYDKQDIQEDQQSDEQMDSSFVKNDRMSLSHKDLKENMKIQLLENQELKKQFEEYKNQIKSVQVLTEEVSQLKLIIGVEDQVQIQKQWSEYYNEKPELYDYAKAFYWTLINCFDAYRIANTGALQQNHDHLKNTNTNKIDQFMDIFQYGSKILSYVNVLPVLKNVTEYIDNIVGTMYDKMKEKRYDDRIMAINRIICLNNDSTAQTSQQQSRMIEMAALEIAKRKKKILYGQMLKDMLQSKTLDNNEDFINKQMEKLYSAALGNRIYLFTTMAGREAVKDVTLLLIYLTLHHETIIEESKDKKLYQIIADCVVEDKTLGIMNKMEVKVTMPATQKQPNGCIIM